MTKEQERKERREHKPCFYW